MHRTSVQNQTNSGEERCAARRWERHLLASSESGHAAAGETTRIQADPAPHGVSGGGLGPVTHGSSGSPPRSVRAIAAQSHTVPCIHTTARIPCLDLAADGSGALHRCCRPAGEHLPAPSPPTLQGDPLPARKAPAIQPQLQRDGSKHFSKREARLHPVAAILTRGSLAFAPPLRGELLCKGDLQLRGSAAAKPRADTAPSLGAITSACLQINSLAYKRKIAYGERPWQGWRSGDQLLGAALPLA